MSSRRIPMRPLLVLLAALLAASSAQAQTISASSGMREVPVLQGHWSLRVPERDAEEMAVLGRISALRFHILPWRWVLEELGRGPRGDVHRAAETAAREKCNGPPTSIQAVRSAAGLNAVVIDCEVMPSWLDQHRERMFVVEHPDGSMLLARQLDDQAPILDRLVPGSAPGPRTETEMMVFDVCGARIGVPIPVGGRALAERNGAKWLFWLHRAQRAPVYGELEVREVKPGERAPRLVQRELGESAVPGRFGRWPIAVVVEEPWIDARYGEIHVPLLAECRHEGGSSKRIVDFGFRTDFYERRPIDLDTAQAFLSSARVLREDSTMQMRSHVRVERTAPRRSHLLIAFAFFVVLVTVVLGLVLERR